MIETLIKKMHKIIKQISVDIQIYFYKQLIISQLRINKEIMCRHWGN